MLRRRSDRGPKFSLLASIVLCGLAIAALPSTTQAATGKLKLSKSSQKPDVLVMTWKGQVRKGMAKSIHTAFETYKDQFHVIEFVLDSPGGSVHEGERVIKVLRDIKKTHRLYTGVLAGKRCNSMCVFIYMEGQKRFAAPASLWLFHEVSRKDKQTNKIYELDRDQWERLIEKYWIPAGVNPQWIAEMKTHTLQTDYYQTGKDLIEQDSGIVHKALSDEHRRQVVPKEPAHSN